MDLKNALKHCLASSQLFAPFVMPLLVEKMAALNIQAKSDAYDAMTRCAEVFAPHVITEMWETLWTLMKRELDGTHDDKLITSIETCLRRVLTCMAQDTAVILVDEQQMLKTRLISTLDDLTAHIAPHFTPLNAPIAKTSARFLMAAAKVNGSLYFHCIIELCRCGVW